MKLTLLFFIFLLLSRSPRVFLTRWTLRSKCSRASYEELSENACPVAQAASTWARSSGTTWPFLLISSDPPTDIKPLLRWSAECVSSCLRSAFFEYERSTLYITVAVSNSQKGSTKPNELISDAEADMRGNNDGNVHSTGQKCCRCSEQPRLRRPTTMNRAAAECRRKANAATRAEVWFHCGPPAFTAPRSGYRSASSRFRLQLISVPVHINAKQCSLATSLKVACDGNLDLVVKRR